MNQTYITRVVTFNVTSKERFGYMKRVMTSAVATGERVGYVIQTDCHLQYLVHCMQCNMSLQILFNHIMVSMREAGSAIDHTLRMLCILCA